MSKLLTRYAWCAVAVLCVIVYLQHRCTVRLTAERDRFEQNSDALLSEVKRYRIDSVTMAIDVKALRLSVDEFKQYRTEDYAKIKAMGIKIRNLEAAARHEIEIKAPIDAQVRDTVIVRDTVPTTVQSVRMDTPHLKIDGIIDRGRLRGEIRVPVTLRQAIWIEYKRRWLFWKRVNAVHQTISSDNPYVEVRYSEYIQVE